MAMIGPDTWSVLPRPLEENEPVELWLALPGPDGAPTLSHDADVSVFDIDGWDVRPARIGVTFDGGVALVTGGWGLTNAPASPGTAGTRVVVRRVGIDGIAEWEGVIATGGDERIDPRLLGAQEVILTIRFTPGTGKLYQRRRTPRLPLRLSPARLVPLDGDRTASLAASDEDLPPVTRLSDVSATGAGVVVDTPLESGTTVALEFELPGEPAPFAVRGRVVEPAVSLHTMAQPQPDGLPGFRRGIEFVGVRAGHERHRLAAALAALAALVQRREERDDSQR